MKRSSLLGRLSVLIVTAAIGASAYFTVEKTLRLPKPEADLQVPAEPPAAAAPVALPKAIEVYFSNTYANNPELGKNDGLNIDRQLARFIGQARSTLDCAFFELESQRVADALIAAHLRGVKVRVVGDSDYEKNPEMKAVMSAGIPVVFDQRSALMHNKFLVADGVAVWTGSFNATDNCSFRNNNNAVMIRSSELARNYKTEFSEMFERGEFGPKSTSNTPYSLVKLGNIDIYNYFSPEDDLPPKVIRFLRAAKKSIRFMAFSFTDAGIADALIEREAAGVKVEGVVEKRGADGKGGVFPRLQKAGVPVLKDGNNYVMHHKVFIIDGLWTITGSYNFTGSGATSNDENLLVIKSEAVAKKFEAEYDRIKRMAQGAS